MKASSDTRPWNILISCEHASNRIPSRFAAPFKTSGIDMNSHRAWDPGALPLARYLAKHCHAPLIDGRHSRLVIDLNRPVGHPATFSPVTRALSSTERSTIESTLHRPYWEQAMKHADAHRPLFHLSIHSFTPVMNGKARNTDIALLYDPAHKTESRIVELWLKNLAQREPTLRLRRNFPYRGTSASLTTSLRKKHSDKHYAGIELEICNLLPQHPRWLQIRQSLLLSVQEALHRLH